mmetsp:Transcript_55786/g.92295  ORF Transcript_55786/g.92295 Transcript_55786/m.92295 type:complete len:212 (+) Transcript_55786:600-1235(+)
MAEAAGGTTLATAFVKKWEAYTHLARCGRIAARISLGHGTLGTHLHHRHRLLHHLHLHHIWIPAAAEGLWCAAEAVKSSNRHPCRPAAAVQCCTGIRGDFIVLPILDAVSDSIWVPTQEMAESALRSLARATVQECVANPRLALCGAWILIEQRVSVCRDLVIGASAHAVRHSIGVVSLQVPKAATPLAIAAAVVQVRKANPIRFAFLLRG